MYQGEIEGILQKIVHLCFRTAMYSLASIVVLGCISAVEAAHSEPVVAMPYSQDVTMRVLDTNNSAETTMPATYEVGYGNVMIDTSPLDVVYYNQTDAAYASKPYGKNNIRDYGCGPTAMAMVVSTLTDHPMDPAEMAQWAYENGYWYLNKGSLHALIPDAASAWGLDVVGCTAEEGEKIQAALGQQKLVVALMGEGHFTTSGHFIVLYGLNENGQVLVADPASRERSEKGWDLDLIMEEASQNAGAGGPFWIIG